MKVFELSVADGGKSVHLYEVRTLLFFGLSEPTVDKCLLVKTVCVCVMQEV